MGRKQKGRAGNITGIQSILDIEGKEHEARSWESSKNDEQGASQEQEASWTTKARCTRLDYGKGETRTTALPLWDTLVCLAALAAMLTETIRASVYTRRRSNRAPGLHRSLRLSEHPRTPGGTQGHQGCQVS
eukprot:1153933-Pelagomonas_calceolata.AAC.9